MYTIDRVLDVINWWWKENANKGENQFDDRDAFEASVQAAAKSKHAFAIDTNPLILWSVYYV